MDLIQSAAVKSICSSQIHCYSTGTCEKYPYMGFASSKKSKTNFIKMSN
jgi:hypothetical protein